MTKNLTERVSKNLLFVKKKQQQMLINGNITDECEDMQYFVAIVYEIEISGCLKTLLRNYDVQQRER